MNCIKCGKEIPDNSAFCPFCSNPVAKSVDDFKTETAENPTVENADAEGQTVIVNPVREKILPFFKDSLFLAMCILVSVSTVFSVFSKNISVLHILFTIFLWLIFSKAKQNAIDIKNMRNVSGTVFAYYVIIWVAIGITALGSVLSIIGLVAAGNAVGFSRLLNQILSKSSGVIGGSDILSNLISGSMIAAIAIAFIIIILVCCIAASLINIFAMRNIHKFARSLYVSAANGVFAFEEVKATTIWLLILGIFRGINSLTTINDLTAFVANGSISAAYIVAYVLLKKYFKPKTSQNIEQ